VSGAPPPVTPEQVAELQRIVRQRGRRLGWARAYRDWQVGWYESQYRDAQRDLAAAEAALKGEAPPRVVLDLVGAPFPNRYEGRCAYCAEIVFSHRGWAQRSRAGRTVVFHPECHRAASEPCDASAPDATSASSSSGGSDASSG
jgi:hypothetical protein